ncbi:hypothetical protein CANARDRAFT_224486 [[Candida] arabinofermentans NRRL YB-2248]|uniref:Ribosomal protein L1 n=1 Tax=[Candida] arabinofermentans NRRL YB-2248 TaxID=983967 RepID=A0A1E4SWW8_9ASCO|nr:hypothetical protein CANARDRAFT_224486 [[Candida] arabinofermentans NRRL YB-2248]
MAIYANPKPAKLVEVKKQKEVSVYKYSVLDEQLQANAIRSLRSLIAHLKSTPSLTSHEPILLVIDTKEPTAKATELVPRIVPVYNALEKPINQKILLITKDPVMTYKGPITEKGSKTENLFHDIMCFKKLKAMSKNNKLMTKLYHENDLVVVDHRVHRLLPTFLSKSIFYKSGQKIPLMIQMARPDPDAKLVKSKKSNKLKDERVEPSYIYKQISSICKNTKFIPSTGNCLTIVIGYSDFKVEKLVENIDCILNYLTDSQFKPVGGIIKKGFKGIDDLHVRTKDSVALPILEKGSN